MTERYRMLRLLLICCLFATAAGADIVRLAVGLAKPPYVEAGGNSGLEVALALATLRLAGHQPLVVQLPQARGLAMLDSGRVDAMLSLVPGSLEGVFYSQPLLHYRNRAIVLQGSGIVLTELSQLAQYRVVAFQNARRLLGDDFDMTALTEVDEAIRMQIVDQMPNAQIAAAIVWKCLTRSTSQASSSGVIS